MDTTKVSELVKAFGELTAEEKRLALRQILPAVSDTRTVSGTIAWGEQAAALIESLDLGDYSDIGDSVDWVKQQRNTQNERRLWNRDGDA